MSFRKTSEFMHVCCDSCRHCYYENWGTEGLPNFQPQCNRGYIVESVVLADDPSMFNVEPNWLAHGTYEALSDEERVIFNSGHCPEFEEKRFE